MAPPSVPLLFANVFISLKVILLLSAKSAVIWLLSNVQCVNVICDCESIITVDCKW